ncbi:hypothetical protein [Chitinophaga qingshengii]|uniref:Fibronectin type-III domain-containing protein n=1 Tax=Chitinophaga qingshengii TaxID=1569794 RepID=A0ABR7TT38_9BACT|nr:hypothetical protein [Chitinophaga qingshengii]MBC9932773.1 hypothetical protein [Chitinophaga qingshengii]
MKKDRIHRGLMVTAICMLFALCSDAQRKDTARVQLIARAGSNSILLRWAATTPRAWKLCNQYGFELWRYTVVRAGKVLDQPEVRQVYAFPFKPKPLKEWEGPSQKDQYAAIIAQAIYGDKFEVTGGDDKGIAKLVNQSQELEQRFSFSLYAADHSFAAARLAGWGWEDVHVKPDEKYLYRIRPLVPASKMKIDSGGVFIGLKDHQPLPAVTDLGALFGDRSVVLSWDYSLLTSYYVSWAIERSVDGKTFERVNRTPVTNFNNKDQRPSPRMYFIDSLRDNHTVYYYRVRGLSPFGEAGPPSVEAKGKGRHVLAYVPNIRTRDVNEKGEMELTWDFEQAGDSLITGFTLNQGLAADGPYVPVLERLAPASRKLVYDKLEATNYFTITAIGKDGGASTSFPVLVQPVDSIPPAAPAGLKGSIDSTGAVTLTWDANTEKDLMGYKVFRASNWGEELSPLLDSIHLTSPLYHDTVVLKSLNSKVYYAVAALDKRYNQSPFSLVLELKKPDIVPPGAPVFSGYKISGDTVLLTWARSSDEDVALHLLYRREGVAATTQWQLLKQFADTTSAFADTRVTGGKQYSYLILARDSSGLESKPLAPLTIHVPSNPNDYMVKNFTAYVNREQRYVELSWTDRIEDLQEYHCYRALKGKPMLLWKVLPAGQRRMVDSQVKTGENYEYRIKAVLKNGVQGKYAALEVQY